jgi:GLPGLI family protein
MKRNLFLIITALLLKGSIYAQTPFFHAIKVEFEKTIYVRQMYKELEPEWYEMIKDHLPQTAISYFDYIGDTTKSIYKPGREGIVDLRSGYQPIADKNVVYSDFKAGKMVSLKPVFEETFLVEDSLAKIKWKITSDTREIAGFECRKAVGILNDSIGVFAFYTDQLLVSGGPESIHGLPGMILGMGIPRLHITWFATKVEVNGVNLNSVVPASKGKKVTNKSMIESLEKVLKRWGDYGSKLIMNFVI